tara:strand:+ start:653 stop:2359 length:1707 start_codon:yes stop_codon:yes gene_type:complete
MSIEGIKYAINSSFTNNDNLLAYYDFTSGTGTPLSQASSATTTTNYTVTVQNVGGNKYFIDGVQQPTLQLTEGNTYVFDWSDSSAQGHPVRFSTTNDGTHGGGSEYTIGVTKDDSNYKTTIVVASSAPILYYYCQYHGGMGGQANTPSAVVRNVINNQIPAIDTGLYSGIILDSNGDVSVSKNFATGTFLNNNKARLSASNLKIPTTDLNYNSLTAIFDFEFDSSTPVTGGVLFGSLDKTSGSANGEVITGAKGYNFGVNDRGKLFYQGFDRRGDYICVASNIELSKRNIISFSLGADNVEISRIDYLNDNIHKQNFTIDTNYIANSDQFYLGGSNFFHSTTTGDTKSLSGFLNQFALISGYTSSEIVKTIGSGMIGEYFFSQAASTSRVEVTGFSETVVYRTGITGYEFNPTGTLTISTGRDMQTGSSKAGGTQAVVEGDKFFKYYELNNGSVKTFYKEEIGYLDPTSGFTYVPTGSGAFATLGLRNVGDSIATHVETEGLDSEGNVTINLYESVAQTGTLSEISGITQTPLTGVVTIPAIAVSGVRLTGNSQDFKKDYIYYLGQRL